MKKRVYFLDATQLDQRMESVVTNSSIEIPMHIYSCESLFLLKGSSTIRFKYEMMI